MRNQLPTHYMEAEEYFRTSLLTDESWFKKHCGEFVAIVSHQVVDHDRDFHELFSRIRPTYGHGPIFISLVSKHGDVARLRLTARTMGGLSEL